MLTGGDPPQHRRSRERPGTAVAPRGHGVIDLQVIDWGDEVDPGVHLVTAVRLVDPVALTVRVPAYGSHEHPSGRGVVHGCDVVAVSALHVEPEGVTSAVWKL